MADQSDAAILDPTGRFPQRLAADRAEIASRLSALWPAPDSGDRLAELETLVHRLAGAAGTFGHAEVSAAAIAFEDALIAARAAPQAHRPALDRLGAALLTAIDRGRRGLP